MILLLRLLLVVHLLQLLLLGGFSFHLVSLQHRHRLLHLVKRYLNCIPPKYPSNNTGCANFVSKVDRKTVYMYLSLQAGRVLEHMEKLRVVDLEQHPCDLAGEVRVLALKESISEHFIERSFYLDEREKAFAKHLLLFLHRGSSKHRGGQWLLDIEQ